MSGLRLTFTGGGGIPLDLAVHPTHGFARVISNANPGAGLALFQPAYDSEIFTLENRPARAGHHHYAVLATTH